MSRRIVLAVLALAAALPIRANAELVADDCGNC